jgi:hypothetical protein
LISDADIQADNMRPRSGVNAKEKTAMENIAIVELSDTELDIVAAGSLVNISVPINIGVQVAGNQNIAVFSLATQSGRNTLIQNLLGVA